MAAAFDDEDLSVDLPDLERDRRRDVVPPPPSQNNPSAKAIPPNARPIARPNEGYKQSPATTRDMQRLDQYQTIRILGEGSFGKVKLAIHQPSGRQVALKIISRRKLLSRDMVGRVEREIQYLQLLRHPHSIKLYGIHLGHGGAQELTRFGQIHRDRYKIRHRDGPGVCRKGVV